MSGYDIRKTVQESIRFFWSESYGQIYPALKRLGGYKECESV
jgi:PadR family transcriptional regulator AphA